METVACIKQPDSVSPPQFVPVTPHRPTEWPSILRMLKLARENALSIWPQEVYEKGIIDRSNIFANVLLAHDADLVHHIFVSNSKNYCASRAQRHLFRSIFGRDNLFVREGHAWRLGRRPMDDAFSLDQTRRHEPMIVEQVNRALTRFIAAIDAKEPCFIDQELSLLTWRIIFPLTISVGDDPIIEETCRIITRNRNSIGRVSAFTFFSLPEWTPAFARGNAGALFKTISAYLRETIALRRDTGARHDDLLDRYLHSGDEDPAAQMTGAAIVQNLTASLAAGHETTALTMSWCLYLLANSPNIQAEIAAEIAAAAGDGPVTFAALSGMPKLAAVLKETLRLYPALPFLAREALGEDSFKGFRIKKGATIITSPYVMHRHQAYWDGADAFNPYRFLDHAAPGRHRLAYIPFGVGPRTCPGRHLAQQEIMLTLATLLRDLDFAPAPGHIVRPIVRVTLRPHEPLQLTVRRR